MKKLFPLAIMAIVTMSATILTSCDKNDDGYGQAAKILTAAQASAQNGQTSVQNGQASAQAGQAQTDHYTISIDMKNILLRHADGSFETIQDMLFREIEMVSTKEKAMENFQAVYDEQRSDMKKKISEQYYHYKNHNAVITFTLKNSKGDIILYQNVK